MLLRIPDVLTPDELTRAAGLLRDGEWVDGRVTAGHQSARVKDNVQLPEGSPAARRLGEIVLATGVQRLGPDGPDHPSAVMLTGVYHNLLRQWAEV